MTMYFLNLPQHFIAVLQLFLLAIAAVAHRVLRVRVGECGDTKRFIFLLLQKKNIYKHNEVLQLFFVHYKKISFHKLIQKYIYPHDFCVRRTKVYIKSCSSHKIFELQKIEITE